jgi:Tfp pilus assembly protein PilE
MKAEIKVLYILSVLHSVVVQHYKNYIEMNEEKHNLCNDFLFATIKIWDVEQR